MSIGGVPNLASIGVNRSQFASTPIRILSGDDRFRYYVISINSVSMLAADSPVPADGPVTSGLFADKSGSINDMASGPAENGSKISRGRDTPPPATSDTLLTNVCEEYIVDSGTTLSFLPASIVNKIASMFEPPAILDPSSGFLFVPCNAKAPQIGIKIGGSTFWFNSKDLFRSADYTGQQYISGIQDHGRLGGINILGDTFLSSILAAFDVGTSQMRFAARPDYQSENIQSSWP